MSNVLDGILAGGAVPPWLPRDAQDARNFSYWAQLLFLLSALLFFIWGIVNFAWWNIIWGSLQIVLAILFGLAGFIYLKKYVIDEIDHGRFHEAKNNMIIWMIIGFPAFVITGVLLLLAYVKLSDAMAPQTPGYTPVQGTAPAPQYQPPQYQQQQPYQQQPAQAQAQQPPAQQQMYYQPPPQQAPTDHKYQMMKCKNCGVQFPAFMTNCPNCGSPK